MPLTKNVDGEHVELTAKEEAAIRAEWAQADAEAAKPKPPTLVERVEALETAVAAMIPRATK